MRLLTAQEAEDQRRELASEANQCRHVDEHGTRCTERCKYPPGYRNIQNPDHFLCELHLRVARPEWFKTIWRSPPNGF